MSNPLRNPVHESMCAFTIGTELYNYYRVRVWREEKTAFSLGNNQDLYDAARDLGKAVHMLNASASVKMIAERIGSMDRVNAVEVLLGPSRQGIVFYPDWK